jgi:hypothetical protein
MKTLLFVASACLLSMACACSVSGSGTDQLHIGVALTTGEHSRDSSSDTTTITVERNAIVWERTYSGRRRKTPALRREFKLSPAEKGNLLELIRSNNLLVTDSIELPRYGSNFRYFEISVDITLGEKKGALNLSGPRNAVSIKEEKLYQNTLTLVKELYRIMTAQDKDVDFAELILEPV